MKTTFAIFLLFSALAVVGQDKIYWTDRGGSTIIRRANTDGTNVEDLTAPSIGAVEDILFDRENKKVYWSEWKRIRRANLDGTNMETLVSGLDVGDGIDLDLENGKMYWTDRGSNKIQRSNLDGTDIEDLLDSPVPESIRLDVQAGKMYWTDWQGSNQKIYKANLDGTGKEVIIETALLNQPFGLDLDLINKKMYWTDRAAGTINRANLDGTDITVLVSGLNIAVDVALDMTNEKMYWIQLQDGKIARANLDGSMIEEIITANLSFPTGLNVFIESSTTTEPTTKANIKIAPNPSDGIFQIQCDEWIDNIKILGSDGSFKFEKKIFYKTGDINMSDYPAGAYILQIELEDKKLYENIVVY